jgi:hypothetical protein
MGIFRSLAMGFASIALYAACGGSGSRFGEDAPPTATPTDDDGGAPLTDDGGGANLYFGDATTANPCKGLQCQQQACGGGTSTTVTGTVWDPAGKNPLYNAIVYVPNAPLDPITHGATCDKCGTLASGAPVVTTITDTKGQFVLKDVPVGKDIPLVIQIGKWRRQLVLPEVKACVDNPISDKNQTRLPKNKTEGDMPKIALTGGCDPIHTLMQKIGIDPAEFTNDSGAGTVHVFAGKKNQNAGIAGATDAYAFWGNLQKMMQYDIIINECECSPYPRDTAGNGYANMAAYLNAGGRAFNSHYHINFFGEQRKADPGLQSTATWSLWGSCNTPPQLIDMTFPKGQAMADWLQNLPASSGWGPSIKTSPHGQLQTSCMVRDIVSTKPGLSQRWIYESNGQSVGYISINAPVNLPPDDRCGRAVLTDLHVGSGAGNMTEQEAALEFMLFDLSSCVQDDQKPPAPPPPK